MTRLVIDDALAYADRAFGHLGHVTKIPGRAIDRAAVAHADVLITRSVTRVDAQLLAGSPVRLVASATAGVDHIDALALADAGIEFAHAPGCNARAVVEYVLCVLTRLEGGVEEPRTVGIVGCGQIGGRLDATLRALGHRCLLHDPPLAQRGDPRSFVDAQTLLATADVVTFHVPGIADGPHRTHHWLDAQALRMLRPGACIINASRGNVVDNDALLQWLRKGSGLAALDVWEDEPRLRWPLLDAEGLIAATPHIAGYTLEGKVRATTMIERAVARHLGQPSQFDPSEVLGQAGETQLGAEPAGNVDAVLRALSSIDTDDAVLRALRDLPLPERPPAFEQLRRGYAFRRELDHYAVAPRAASLWASLPRESST